MKLTLAIFFLSILQVSANVYSQINVNLDVHNKSIREVLKTIEQQSKVRFFYSDDLLVINELIDLKADNKNIISVLDDIFLTSPLTYKAYDNNLIVIVPREFLQEQKITGTVTDALTGDPLAGVNVLVEGTLQGVATDLNGKYSLSVSGENVILVFSYIGYTSQRITFSGQTIIDVTLSPEVKQLEEVIVVGYGTQKKINLTGALEVVTDRSLENRAVTNVPQALQGIAPSLNFSYGMQAGEMGSKLNITLRGLGSINGGSPYILVDGIEQDINNINPEDIESISVLKDASASAIYGARAAFGVILITTKKGLKDGITVNYSNIFSFATPLNVREHVNSIDFANYYNECAKNDGQGDYALFSQEVINKMRQYQAGEIKDWTEPDPSSPLDWCNYQYSWANFDWFKQIYKTWVPNTRHNLSVSGGNDRSQYYISGSTYQQEGLLRIGDDKYGRNNFDLKITTKVYDWLKFNIISKYSETKLGRPSYDRFLFYHRDAQYHWPTMEPYTPDGHMNSANEQIWFDKGGRYNENGNELIIIPGIEIEPIKGWVIYANYRWKMNNTKATTHIAKVTAYDTNGDPYYMRSTSSFASNMYESSYNSPNVYTTYTKKLGNHEFIIMAGFEQELSKYASTYAKKDNLITDEVSSISTATGEDYVDGTIGHWATRSYFGRLNYNFKEKYLAEFSIRNDGSSKFARGYRWGSFPSASIGYVISKESFWKPMSNYINMLKIRASYGSLGNQNVSNYLYIAQLPVKTNLPAVVQSYYILGNEIPLYAGMPALISPDITWEEVNTLNFGIDAGFLNNKLTVSADYFVRKTSYMLGPSESLPAVLGSSVPQSNNAKLRTNGFEFILGWEDRISNITYGAKFMLSDAKSKILEYNNPNNLLSAAYYIGKTVGEIWGYTTEGLFQTDQEAQDWVDQTYLSNRKWSAGDVKYADLNNDGKINPGKNTLEDHGDLSIIGNSTPRYNFGLMLNAAWKGFDINLLWQGVGKRELNLTSGSWWNGGVDLFGCSPNGQWQSVVFKQHLDYWTEDNKDAYYSKPYFVDCAKNQVAQTRYLQNGAYIRLKTLQLGYTLPQTFTRKAYIKNLRIFISGENLLTFTKMSKIFDPETTTGGYGYGKNYPLQKFYSFGLDITI